MEKSRRNTLLVLIFLSCLIVAMFLCGALGYFLAKKTAPQKSAAVNKNNHNDTGIYTPLKRPVDLKEAFSPVENIDTEDKNDYLVISEGKLVNLYVISSDGNKTFDSVLEIDKNSLTESDCFLLDQGIILDTREDLWSLIEDYTS